VFWYEVGVQFTCQKYRFISQSTLPPGPHAIQVNEARKLIKRHKQRRATSREGARTPHGPALSPVISGQGRSPSARPGGHHSGPPQPRRHCNLPSTAKPAQAARLQLQHGAAYFKATRRATTYRAECRSRRHTAEQSTGWSFPHAPQAQDKAPRQEGSKTASRAAHNKRKQPAFVNKCDAHRACRCGGIAKRDGRLLPPPRTGVNTAHRVRCPGTMTFFALGFLRGAVKRSAFADLSSDVTPRYFEAAAAAAATGTSVATAVAAAEADAAGEEAKGAALPSLVEPLWIAKGEVTTGAALADAAATTPGEVGLALVL